MTNVITSSEYTQILESSTLREELNPFGDSPYLVVDLRDSKDALATPPGTPTQQHEADPRLPTVPVIGIRKPSRHTNDSSGKAAWVDVFANDEQELEALIQGIHQAPLASATLVQLLRHNARTNITDGLLAESLAYSTLQHSHVFTNWLADQLNAAEHTSATEPTDSSDAPSVLLAERTKDELHLTLNRPHVHNAYNTHLRDALCEALHLALDDPSITRVHVRGNGSSYCAGGDLTEFGQARDAGIAHAARTTRSAGALVWQLRQKVHFHLHGACIGAGIEIPAFAQHITAHKDTFFQLPELSFGLVPGAGGTVSVTHRIGRHRTASLALRNHRLSAQDALAWGLIDEIS